MVCIVGPEESVTGASRMVEKFLAAACDDPGEALGSAYRAAAERLARLTRSTSSCGGAEPSARWPPPASAVQPEGSRGGSLSHSCGRWQSFPPSGYPADFWETVPDPATGRSYYWNAMTGQSAWALPLPWAHAQVPWDARNGLPHLRLDPGGDCRGAPSLPPRVQNPPEARRAPEEAAQRGERRSQQGERPRRTPARRSQSRSSHGEAGGEVGRREGERPPRTRGVAARGSVALAGGPPASMERADVGPPRRRDASVRGRSRSPRADRGRASRDLVAPHTGVWAAAPEKPHASAAGEDWGDDRPPRTSPRTSPDVLRKVVRMREPRWEVVSTALPSSSGAKGPSHPPGEDQSATRTWPEEEPGVGAEELLELGRLEVQRLRRRSESEAEPAVPWRRGGSGGRGREAGAAREAPPPPPWAPGAGGQALRAARTAARREAEQGPHGRSAPEAWPSAAPWAEQRTPARQQAHY